MDNLPFEIIEREVLIKKQADTNKDLGQDPNNRPMHELIDFGVININKPKGPTSHQVSAFIQSILKIKKSGHSGTLDPGVTGCLPVATGRATRIVQGLLKAGKEYVGIMHIHKEVSKQDLDAAIKKFTGKIQQLPPIKSSVKRQIRTREVYYFEILEADKQDILFRTGVQAGTYIRKLCHDLGKYLKVGAHMSELIRTKAGPFKLEDTITLQDLSDAFYYYKEENNEIFLRKCIQPIETAVQHLPKIWVLDTTISTLTHGVDLKVPGISKLNNNIQKDEMIAVMSLKEELVAIGNAEMSSEEIMKQDKGLAVTTHKVFMKESLYKN